MSSGIESRPIQERFQHLFDVISGQRFLQMKSLGNEVPFFICPFKPEETVEMERLEHQLGKRLEQSGIQVLEINLYDLCVELVQERGIWEKVLAIEEQVSKGEILELLQNVLDPKDHLIPAIARKLSQSPEYQVLFLTGVGATFPHTRSHNVLENLQSTAKTRPTVMFFPGTYTHSLESGASLNLFGRLNGKYYRAFNIYDCEA